MLPCGRETGQQHLAAIAPAVAVAVFEIDQIRSASDQQSVAPRHQAVGIGKPVGKFGPAVERAVAIGVFEHARLGRPWRARSDSRDSRPRTFCPARRTPPPPDFRSKVRRRPIRRGCPDRAERRPIPLRATRADADRPGGASRRSWCCRLRRRPQRPSPANSQPQQPPTQHRPVRRRAIQPARRRNMAIISAPSGTAEAMRRPEW